MAASEHIVLESEVREIPDARNARTVHARIELRSRLRRRVLQLEILDYYYLSVRSRSGSKQLDYILDLRFVDAPRLTRRIAWRWIGASLALAAVPLAIAARFDLSAMTWWQHNWLAVCSTITALWALATIVGAYRTTETIRLISIHGAATLLDFTAGLGTFRRIRRFLPKLSAHIRAAYAARRRTKGEHLRDEMREHQRLKDLGVLSADDYQASQARILGQHSAAPTT
jgi:hypothetical protein